MIRKAVERCIQARLRGCCSNGGLKIRLNLVGPDPLAGNKSEIMRCMHTCAETSEYFDLEYLSLSFSDKKRHKKLVGAKYLSKVTRAKYSVFQS